MSDIESARDFSASDTDVSDYSPSDDSSPELEDDSSSEDSEEETSDAEAADDVLAEPSPGAPAHASTSGRAANMGSKRAREDDVSGTLVSKRQAAARRPSTPAVQPWDTHQLHNGNLHNGGYYRNMMQTFNKEEYMRKVYKPNSIKAMDSCLFEWTEFCREVLEQPWATAMRELSLERVHAFVHWHLNQKKGKDGRVRRGTKKVSALRTWWDTFRVLFGREMLADIDWQVQQSAVNGVIERVYTDFSLDTQKKSNRPMNLEQLKLQVETTLGTTEKSFKLGEQRILAVLFLLLLAPAGSRPDSILQIRYRHLRLALYKPPSGGSVQLVVWVELEHTKSYRGQKQVKTFIIPEVIYDPTLFLSPHVYLLAILFQRRAFRLEELNDHPEWLETMTVLEDERFMAIPLKKERFNERLFRGVVKDVTGWRLSESPLTYHTVHKSLQRIGKIIGWQDPPSSYTLRYMAGNNLNEDDRITREMQNLIMDHAPNSSTFQTNYLNRCITFDVFALQMGRAPQQNVVREAASFGYARSARRPLGLTTKQAADLTRHPVYKHFEDHLKKMQEGTAQWQEAKRDLKKAFRRVRYAEEKKAIGKEWTERQAVADMISQINGEHVPGGAARRKTRPMSPAQREMVDALYESMETTLELQLRRRTKAIKALMAYCPVQEPLRNKLVEDRIENLQMRANEQAAVSAAPAASAAPVAPAIQPSVPSVVLPSLTSLPPEEIARLRRLVTVQEEGQTLRACYICVAEALHLKPLDPNLPTLCHEYRTATTLSRHWKRGHLKFMDQKQPPPCPICHIGFGQMMHLRNHAQLVHGVLQSPRARRGKQSLRA